MNPKEIFEFVKVHLHPCKAINAVVFNTMRILKKINPGDSYFENYLWHYKKRGDNFVDYYHFLWILGSHLQPDNIMEIGCRTGISICQLLSSMMDYKDKRVVLFDVFNDGFISPEIVKMNLSYLNIPVNIVEFVMGDSAKTVPAYKQEKLFDYILVDGNHERGAARQDLENVIKMFAPGGILIFDDIAEDGCNLKDVWESFKKDHPEEFYYIENYDGKGIGVGVKK